MFLYHGLFRLAQINVGLFQTRGTQCKWCGMKTIREKPSSRFKSHDHQRRVEQNRISSISDLNGIGSAIDQF